MPFQDADGLWWIYREDDDKQFAPLGPFLTSGYAKDQERYARYVVAPFPAPLSHRQPRKPFVVPR